MKNMDKYLSLLVGIEAWSMWNVMMGYQYDWLKMAAYSVTERPFVYRALLPFLSRVLEYILGGDIVLWLGVLFVGSAVGFYFASRYLVSAFQDNMFAPFVACQVLFAVTFDQIKPYDYATAMFFALALGLLARGKHGVFLAVFAVASLNRETTFLLTLFYAVYFFKKLPAKKYFFFIATQVFIYGAIKYFLEHTFENSGGQDVFIFFGKTISTYAHYWYIFLPLLLVFFIDWKRVPEFIRVFMMVVVPIQVVLHLLFGMPFETRVFAESVPVIVFCFSLHGTIQENLRAIRIVSKI